MELRGMKRFIIGGIGKDKSGDFMELEPYLNSPKTFIATSRKSKFKRFYNAKKVSTMRSMPDFNELRMRYDAIIIDDAHVYKDMLNQKAFEHCMFESEKTVVVSANFSADIHDEFLCYTGSEKVKIDVPRGIKTFRELSSHLRKKQKEKEK